MTRKYNELYIGLSVIITVAVVIAAILFLEKNNFLESGITINMVVQDAQGISVGGNVYYKGLDVGSVNETDIIPKGILLKLKISKIDSIPDDSRFVITTSSLIGGKAIEIQGGRSKTYLKNNSYMKGEENAGFSEIIRGVGKATENIRQISGSLDSLTNVETREKITGILTEIDESVRMIHRSLKSSLYDVNKAIKNVKDITTDNKAPVDSIIDRLSEYSLKLNTSIQNLEKITSNLKDVTAGLKSGKGTAGKLLTSDELYHNIINTVANLNSLINDIKEHPERYVHVSLF